MIPITNYEVVTDRYLFNDNLNLNLIFKILNHYTAMQVITTKSKGSWNSKKLQYIPTFSNRSDKHKLSRPAFFDCEKCIPNKMHPSPTNTCLPHPSHEFIEAYLIQIPPPQPLPPWGHRGLLESARELKACE